MTTKTLEWQIDLLSSLWMLALTMRGGSELINRTERNCITNQNLCIELMANKLQQAKG
ncbi:hypothetical protein SAMN05518848_11248 [Paenibacillus sp. PDC88]|nr:hypothetical protein SAMN05518848_11248 [Paenibacillus sp. PDC88]SFS88285.1 hypothetical protein SAMN04488601_10644 [Paenibacillus sp. 453mf]